MPNVTVHMVLADRALEGLEAAGVEPPFDVGDPAHRNAFYQGSLGPDLGYFPGGNAFLSDLAHYVRSGALARNLVRRARTPVERAFAWGWVTHVLADQAVHPLVGRGVHERVHGDPDGFVRAMDAKPTHVRVEVGLDAHYASHHPELRDYAPEPVFDGRTIAFLCEAYRDTYGLAVDPTVMLTSHLTTIRKSEMAMVSIDLMGSALDSGTSRPGLAAGRWILERTLAGVDVLGVDWWTLIFLNPLRVRSWLVEAVDRIKGEFGERFFGLYLAGLAELPDYNLDTGEVERVIAHPCTASSVERLESLVGAVDWPGATETTPFRPHGDVPPLVRSAPTPRGPVVPTVQSA